MPELTSTSVHVVVAGASVLSVGAGDDAGADPSSIVARCTPRAPLRSCPRGTHVASAVLRPRPPRPPVVLAGGTRSPRAIGRPKGRVEDRSRRWWASASSLRFSSVSDANLRVGSSPFDPVGEAADLLSDQFDGGRHGVVERRRRPLGLRLHVVVPGHIDGTVTELAPRREELVDPFAERGAVVLRARSAALSGLSSAPAASYRSFIIRPNVEKPSATSFQACFIGSLMRCSFVPSSTR